MSAASGYSTELYDTIAAFGLHRGAAILDVGCGDGTASAPFAQNGFPVTGIDASPQMLLRAREQFPEATFLTGSAEKLPFPDERFDVVINAQTIQFVDRTKALNEAYRVLRRGGILAIWWKQLMSQEGVKEIRDQAYQEAGAEPQPEGLAGGFKEFYAAEQFSEQTLRVVPWRTTMPLEAFLQNERERVSNRSVLGGKLERYVSSLERRLRERLGNSGNPAVGLAFIQYLYLAKKH
jgi:SAM-dependent methyltransferase